MNKRSPENPNDGVEEKKVEALVGLLDFYSDRAEAQASFLVASVFGLFALLSMVQNITNMTLVILSVIPYVMLALIGFRCFQRFGAYASTADKIKQLLEKYADPTKLLAETVYVNGKKKKITLRESENRAFRKGSIRIMEKYKKAKFIRLAFLIIFGTSGLLVYSPKFVILLRQLLRSA